MRRVVVTDREDNPTLKTWNGVKDSAADYQIVWKPYASALGTSLVSVVYSSEEGGIGFSNLSVTDGTASVRIIGTQTGPKLVKMTATMDDGSTAIRYLLINVMEPRLAAADSIRGIFGVR